MSLYITFDVTFNPCIMLNGLSLIIPSTKSYLHFRIVVKVNVETTV